MQDASRDELERMIGEKEEALNVARAELAELRRRREPEEFTDHVLYDRDGGAVHLKSLFGDRQDLLIVHNMGTSCPYCTMWADGLNGLLRHLEDRAGFAVVSPDPPGTQREFADGRGWGFRMYSSAGSEFTKAAGFEHEGSPMPGVSAFRLDEGRIVRTGRAGFGPGDDFCATWHLFDLLKDGADGWQAKFAY